MGLRNIICQIGIVYMYKDKVVVDMREEMLYYFRGATVIYSQRVREDTINSEFNLDGSEILYLSVIPYMLGFSETCISDLNDEQHVRNDSEADHLADLGSKMRTLGKSDSVNKVCYLNCDSYTPNAVLDYVTSASSNGSLPLDFRILKGLYLGAVEYTDGLLGNMWTIMGKEGCDMDLLDNGDLRLESGLSLVVHKSGGLTFDGIWENENSFTVFDVLGAYLSACGVCSVAVWL